MPKIPEAAQRSLQIAQKMGGGFSREFAAAADAVMSPDAPTLARKTRLVTAQTAAVIGYLGAYTPGAVPVNIKKRMRKDAQIRFALAAAKAPVLTAPKYFQSRSAEAKALCKQAFIDSGFLSDLLDSSLNAIDFGFQNHEQLWRRVEDYKVEWDVPGDDGGTKTKSETRGVTYLPSNFKDLDPAHTTLLWDDEGVLFGSIFGVNVKAGTPEEIKKAVKKGEINFLPPDKMFLFTPIFEFQNYYGEGRLDWAYDYWYWCNLLYLTAMRWYERKSDPPLLVRAPASAEVVPDPEDRGIDGDLTGLTDADARQDGIGAALRAASNLRSHGQAGLPSEPFMDENGKPSNVRAYDIEEMAVRDMHPAFIDMIDHLDKKKTRAIFVPDTVLSRDRQVGTLGSTEAATDVAVEIQNQILGRFIRAFNEQVLAPFLRYNGVKEKVTLVSPGVFRDNRALLKDMILKAFEADMLAEQKLGRIDPQSLTVTFDRQTAAASLGLPLIEAEPGAKPRLIPLPDAGGDGPEGGPKRGTGVGSSPQTSQKGNAEAGKGKKAGVPTEGKALAMAEESLERDLLSRAERAENAHVRAGASTQARETLSVTETAVAAVLLWMVIRSTKQDASGRRIKGDKSLDSLVWASPTRLLPAAQIAANFPRLDVAAAEYESRGLRLASGQRPLHARASRGVNSLLASMRNEIATSGVNGLIERSVKAGEAEAKSILSHNGVTPTALSAAAVANLTEANVEGLLLNIDNIARRNGTKLVEKALQAFAAGRQLGLIEEVAGFRFNRLHSDLSIEAHIRAAYRGGLVQTALESGVRSFMQTPSDGIIDHDLDLFVGTDDFWRAEGERRGAPDPHETFGWHHGSTSYWYPVPASRRIRTPFVE